MQEKSSKRVRADAVKPYRCKYLIVVIENPKDLRNIGTIIRNVNALGVAKTYIIDPRKKLPDDWQDMRNNSSLSTTSVSAIKWSFVKRFDSTEDCLKQLEEDGYESIVTSPHVKGKNNVVLHEGEFTHPKLAVWFGNESSGISNIAVQNSVMCVNIPMFGMIESLNLGTTSGIVLYEVCRQRREYRRKYKYANQHGQKFID